jgi:hypothetical protein
MNQECKKYPDCFGTLKKVFPMGEDGLRHTPRECLPCLHKTHCLRAAIQGKDGLKVKEEHQDGLKVKEEHLERAYNSGMVGFFERWSKKKDIHRRKKNG